MSIFIVALISSLVINTFFFAIAATSQTDQVTDLSYALSFILIILEYLFTQTSLTIPQILISIMIISWGIRLGSYLFYRVLKLKQDHRFDGIREDLRKFAKFWLFQALSVVVIIWPAVIVLSARTPPSNYWFIGLGFLIWLTGIIIETLSDWQKSAYKLLPNPPTPWASTGLYKHARFPNYFGEILCWLGIFVFSIPYLSGWSWLSIISPLYISSILLFVTGIPPLEKHHQEKYGVNPEYKNYLKNTRLLIPLPK